MSNKAPAKPEEQPPSVSFNFTDKFKAPENFGDLTDDASVKVIVYGKVRDIAHGKDYEGKKYQNFSLDMDKVEVQRVEPKSIAERKPLRANELKILNKSIFGD